MQGLFQEDPDELDAAPGGPSAPAAGRSSTRAGTLFLLVCYGLALVMLVAPMLMLYFYIVGR